MIDLTELEKSILSVYISLSETEEKDADAFLVIWKQCVNEQQTRDLIKSFRRQMICVAAGEALSMSPAVCEGKND